MREKGMVDDLPPLLSFHVALLPVKKLLAFLFSIHVVNG